MSLLILHSRELEKLETADQYQADSCMGLLENKPQIKAPRVTPLEGVSTSTVAPVDVAHTYGSPPYVDIAARYALRSIGVRGVMNPQGFGIDERRFANMASSFIRTLKPVFAPSANFGVD